MTVPEQNTQVQMQETEKTDTSESNFAKFRKHSNRQLEQEREARAQAERRVQELEQERLVRQREAQDDDSDDDSGEPYVDNKRLKKAFNNFAQTMEQKIDKKAEEKARSLIEQDRQLQYVRQNPDFREILTEENVQKFAAKYPDIAEPMLEMPDNFARQKLLYGQIKALGVHKPPETPKSSMQDVINNNRKPLFYQPTMSGAAPPYANNGDFSPTGQKNAYAKMKDLINNRKSG